MQRSFNMQRGYPIALGAAAVLSTTAIFIRHLTQTYGVPALVLALWRDAFVALTLLPVLWLLRPALLRVERRHWRYLTLYGLLLSIFNALWTLSVALNGAAVATVLVYCSAAFTALLARWLLNERFDLGKLVAIAFCLAGCTLVSGALDAAAWQANPVGILAGILAGLGYAIYSLLGRQAAQRGLSPWTTLLYTFAAATLFLLLFNLISGGPLPGSAAAPAELLWLGDSLAGWGVLFVLAAGPTVLGFGLYNMSLVYLPSSVANLIVTLEPVFTAAVAYVLLGIQIAGSLMILAGVLFLRIYEGWLAKQTNETVVSSPLRSKLKEAAE